MDRHLDSHGVQHELGADRILKSEACRIEQHHFIVVLPAIATPGKHIAEIIRFVRCQLRPLQFAINLALLDAVGDHAMDPGAKNT